MKSNFLSDRVLRKAIFCRIELCEKQFFVGSSCAESNFLSDQFVRKAIFCRIES